MIPFQLHRHIPLVFRSRHNQVKAERDQALRDLQAVRQTAYFRHRPMEIVAGEEAATGTVEPPDDAAVVQRIIAAYRTASDTSMGPTNSFWLTNIAELRRPEHETLIDGDLPAVQAMLRNPATNNLLYGFDGLARQYPKTDEDSTKGEVFCYDKLLRVAEAVGTVTLAYNEAPPRLDTPAVEDVLFGLDSKFGFRIEFPNPYEGECGLITSRGIASFRAIQSLYQAWRIAQAAPKGRVLEIGGGTGRTAYYTTKFGVRDYTIIDLPLTGVAQAYFLHRVGLDVRLYREARTDGILIAPPTVFHTTEDHYDLIVNVDSFTEMSPETARQYFDEAAKRCSQLLSINPEHNPYRIFDAIRGHPAVAHATREPYWLRNGYVHEMVTFKH